VTPEERRLRERAAPILEEEAEAAAEGKRAALAIAREHEATRRDSDEVAQLKAERAGREIATHLVGSFLYRRPAAIALGRAAVLTEFRQLQREELAAVVGLQEAFADPASPRALIHAADAYALDFARLQRIKADSRLPGSLQRAARALDYRIERIANAEVWGRAVGEIGRIQRRIGLLSTGLLREWHATLERHTCRYCASMHGERIPAHESFEREAPAHFHCHCFTALVDDEMPAAANDVLEASEFQILQ